MDDRSTWDVIIVDDEQDNAGVLKLVFEFHGARVRVAGSGQECLKLLEQGIPSVLLLDVQMPVMSGFELLERIRQRPEWRNLPVVAITAHVRQEDQEQIMAAGFDGYIGKPVNVVTVIDEIERVMQTKGRQT